MVPLTVEAKERDEEEKIAKEEKKLEREREEIEEEKKALFRRGPTVAASLVCIILGAVGAVTGGVAIFAPSYIEGMIVLTSLGPSTQITQGIITLVGVATLILGVFYVVSGSLLWSATRWVTGAYMGIIVSVLGTVVSGAVVLFAPGPAAAAMVVNVLIITLIATETWEERVLAAAGK